MGGGLGRGESQTVQASVGVWLMKVQASQVQAGVGTVGVTVEIAA